MDILEKLYKNSGLLHVAEHVVQFMDNSTMAQCRLVNKELHDLVDKCFRKRAVQELQRLCEKTFQVLRQCKDHYKRMHSNVEIKSCKVCKKSFKSEKNLQKHVAKVHDNGNRKEKGQR